MKINSSLNPLALLLLTTGIAVIQKCRSVANLRWVFLLLIGLTMNALMPNQADAADHITVTREVLLESGVPARPHVITHTKDGGYVVAGGITDYVPWATRIDADGNVRWRYTIEDKAGNRVPGVGKAEYQGAATLPDDTTLLCGHKDVGDESQPRVLGMLTHIDKEGRVLKHRLIHPQGDEAYQLNYLNKCVPWGDGVAVIGHSSRSSGNTIPRHTESFSWILALDSRGGIKWEKLLPNVSGMLVQVLVMPTQDLMLAMVRVDETTQVTLIDRNGVVRAQSAIPGNATLVRPIVDEAVARLIPMNSAPGNLYTLDDRLQEMERLAVITEHATKVAYRANDHSLILFGYQTDKTGVLRASIAWLSPNLREKDVLVFRSGVSAWIDDALPSGKIGEFVAVRQILSAGADEKRLGVILAFVRVK